MSFTLPESTASGGLSHADTTVTQQKTNFTNLRGFLAELLGTSSASKATPRSLLGVDGANITAAVGSSALTIALKTAAGADPAATSSLPIPFRHATLTNGAVAVRESVAATSLVISSGSTLGHTSGVAANIYVYALDTGSAVELAASSTFYGTSFIGSTTAEGGAGAADSATTIYSTTSRSNVAMRLLAVLVSTQATAGTWAAVPTDIRRADMAGVLDSLLTTKGDILVKDANGRLVRLAVGSDGEVLSADSGEASGLKWAAPSGAAFERFNSSGTWNKPAGFSANALVIFEAWGPGAGGGGTNAGSSGGGGGGYARKEMLYSEAASSYAITVAAGGAINTAGGNTTVGAILTAYGGGRGRTTSGSGGGGGGGAKAVGADGTSSVGGVGGAGGDGYGDAGGAGGSGADAGKGGVDAGGGGSIGNPSGLKAGSGYYGGGGGGGGTNGAGAASNGGDSFWGGAGGAGGSVSGTDGAAGTSVHGGNGGALDSAGAQPGGGGGGGSTGGAGGAGRVQVTVIERA